MKASLLVKALEMSDAQLWARSRAGDRDAFGELFERHASLICNYCFRRIGSWPVAEDMLSVVFLEAWRRRDTELSAGEVLPWLYGMAMNSVPKQRRSIEQLDEDKHMQRVLATLRTLPQREREVFVLCGWMELSYENAALALGLTPPVRDLPSGHFDVRRQHLLSEIARTSNRLCGPRQAIGAFSRSLSWRLMAIAVAAAAAAGVLLGVFGLGGTRAGPPPPAAVALDRLARLVAVQPLAPQSGQYLYIESRSNYPAYLGLPNAGTCETRAIDHREIWIATNGSGLIRETTARQQFTSATDRATCLRAHPKMRLRGGGTSSNWFAPQCLELGPTNDWSSLSSDPNMLLQQMRQIDGGPPTPGEDFVHVEDVLRETDAPPAVRATLYRAAARIPGIQLLGAVRDRDGRPGLGVAYSSKRSSSELIFDPKTGELLGEQGTDPNYWAVYLDEKVVNALPRKPPVPLTPACLTGAAIAKPIRGGSVTTGP